MGNTDEKGYSPQVVSIFSGCGGLDLGFHLEGYETIWANDFAEWAVKSFEKNFGKVIHLKDITKINPYTDKTIPKCDIVLGGFPCQDFSIIWKQPGLNGTRGGLFRHFAEFVDAKNPKAFVAENVKGLITANKGKAIETIIKDFESIAPGYVVKPHLYNFAESPQSNLNAFFGKGREAKNGLVKPRHWYEVELIVPKNITEQNGYPKAKTDDAIFDVITDDGWSFKCNKNCGTYGTKSEKSYCRLSGPGRKMHDYKNQLSTIQTLIKNGYTDEALSFTQWSSCKEMVFVCVIWSFDDMGLGEQVILSDKGNRETEQIINIGKVIIFWNRDGRMFYVKDYR